MSTIRQQQQQRGKRSEQSGGAAAAETSATIATPRATPAATLGASKSTIAVAVAAAAAAAAATGPSSAKPTAVSIAAAKPSPTNGHPSSKSKLVFGLNSRTNRVKHDEYAERRGALRQQQQQQQQQQQEQQATATSSPATGKGEASTAKENGGGGAQESMLNSSRIRSPSSRTSRSPLRDQTTVVSRSKSPAAAATKSDAIPQQPSESRSRPATRRGSSPSRRKTADTASSLAKQETDKPARQEDSMKELGNQTMTSQKKTTDASQEQKQQQQPVKRQFNIPPPPQLSNTGVIKQPGSGSVVSYAKSRIYDKPASMRHILGHSANDPMRGSSLLDSGTIPESILSGFKPPKQVNVSKAREKWEGGEPFAKCKSRQRLAAQANKKFIAGTWSMSSVVATQQMQLQQVMTKQGVQKNDSGVKILTRGSVLERVQQFEKAPSSSGSTSGSSSSSSGSSSPGSDGGFPTGDVDLSPLAAAVAAAAMPETTMLTATEAGLALQQPLEPAELRPGSPSSKQALYKTRVSSIQTSSVGQPQDPLNMITLGGPKSPLQSPQANPLGRPNLIRRRSSATSNSSSSIPKFYHPNGKPNTYEIELQKKNIVACFDKFPDRKALISGPTCRRHFHSIALACGFSEYFKEPLCLYVKHQMTNSNLLHNTSTSTAARPHRQSGIGPGMVNGTSVALNRLSEDTTALARTQQQQQQQATRKSLIRAASIDNSTMEKIQNQNFVTCEQFLVCWRQMIATAFDNAARFVHLLTMGQRNYLAPDDFVPLIQSIIDDHPGLKFLRAAPDFHMRYIQTVIARIYFCINKSWTGKISLTELRKSNLLAVLEVLSQEDDINQITDYFSYEHFYVIYCKFWSLDQDHDLLISKEDLAKHNDAAISSRIIERIFMGIVSKQIQATGKMSYSDFVWFLIAEEDKKHPRSIEYWFRLMDLDGDGYISMYEMEYFYYEQTKRLELMNIEALPFIDSACQILDLVNPKEKNKISLADLKRTKMATIFFDTFINLEKYLGHESREFVSTRDVVQDGVVISDWDRYASEEYENLVTEESSV